MESYPGVKVYVTNAQTETEGFNEAAHKTYY